MSHVTWTPLSPPSRFTQCSLNTRGRCSGDCENVLGMETSATLCLLGAGALGAGSLMGEERGGGISCHHTHSLLISTIVCAVFLPMYV